MATRKGYTMATAQVVSADDNEGLSTAIGVATRKAIIAGWQPIGGVAVSGRNAYQAVTRTVNVPSGGGGGAPPIFTP